MKKRTTILLLCILVMIFLLACGKTDNKKEDSKEKSRTDIELNIPADYAGDITQEELDEQAKQEGYKSATLNEDGSVTYIMTKEQHKKMMEELAETINQGVSEMMNSGSYPSFKSVEANDDYTLFKIITSSQEVGMNDSFSVMTLYMYGELYNVFNGTPVDNIRVDFVNSNTGKTIHSSNSADIK